MVTERVVILVAGGTGGHLFPAQALAENLRNRGYDVHLATDTRAKIFATSFAEDHIHIIRSATLTSKSPLAIIKTLWQLVSGVRQSRRLFKRLNPELVVGFGGYPTLPPLYAAINAKIPNFIHEQNAVLGRANKLLATKTTAIACGFPIEVENYKDKLVFTGNPVRASIIAAARKPYVKVDHKQFFNLLVFGGSQGAQFFTDIMPKALALLPKEKRMKIRLVQQVRDNVEEMRRQYKELSVDAEVAVFFNDIADRIACAQFVIARSGASTVAEIAVIGRPALFVPYPQALDHDQALNAAELAKTGGVRIEQQSRLNANKLAQIIDSAMNSPDLLARQAQLVKSFGKENAAQDLAKLAERLIARQKLQQKENN